jgi:hypothetical protein
MRPLTCARLSTLASHMLNELLHEVVEEICREKVSHSESERMNGLGKDCNCENIVNQPAMGEVNNERCVIQKFLGDSHKQGRYI